MDKLEFMKQKKIPFIYRSFTHFYLIYILPTSILTIIAMAFFNDKTFTLDQLKNPGLWFGFIAFQIVFGTCMYFWDYKSRSKEVRENA